MRALLIDPYLCTVRNVEVPDFSHDTVARLIFCGGNGYVRRVDLGAGLTGFTDEDGPTATSPACFVWHDVPGWRDESDPVYLGRMVIGASADDAPASGLAKRFTVDLILSCVTWR